MEQKRRVDAGTFSQNSYEHKLNCSKHIMNFLKKRKVDLTSQISNTTASNIFDEHLWRDSNNQEFVSHLYEEVLQREPDSIGMNYWLGQLNSGAETQHEVLLGFSQSAESTALFTDMTGWG